MSSGRRRSAPVFARLWRAFNENAVVLSIVIKDLKEEEPSTNCFPGGGPGGKRYELSTSEAEGAGAEVESISLDNVRGSVTTAIDGMEEFNTLITRDLALTCGVIVTKARQTKSDLGSGADQLRDYLANTST